MEFFDVRSWAKPFWGLFKHFGGVPKKVEKIVIFEVGVTFLGVEVMGRDFRKIAIFGYVVFAENFFRGNREGWGLTVFAI